MTLFGSILPYAAPGHAVPVSKVQENSWEKEKEQETQAGKQEIGSTEDLNGELPSGPLGKGKNRSLITVVVSQMLFPLFSRIV